MGIYDRLRAADTDDAVAAACYRLVYAVAASGNGRSSRSTGLSRLKRHGSPDLEALRCSERPKRLGMWRAVSSMPDPSSRRRHLLPLDVLDGARVAVVHEWVAARAGSEKVFEAFAQLFPQADLFALTLTPGVRLDTGERTIRSTWLNRLGNLRDRRELTLPLMPLAWQSLPADYDVVITSSHAFARTARPARHAMHFSYVHAPARYLWTPEIDGRAPPRLAAPLTAALKALDRRTTQNTDSLAANSAEVAARIRTFYGCASTVIPPPVDTRRFRPPTVTRRRGLLCLGRLIEYKRFDVAIEAAALAREPLTVAGRGPDEIRLRRLAERFGGDVTFIRGPSDAQVSDLLHTHRALLFPGREDFGIVPVEAAASGLPTIALGEGGALDTVVPQVNGWLVDRSDAVDFMEAIESSRRHQLDEGRMHRHALDFSYAKFRDRIYSWLTNELRKT